VDGRSAQSFSWLMLRAVTQVAPPPDRITIMRGRFATRHRQREEKDDNLAPRRRLTPDHRSSQTRRREKTLIGAKSYALDKPLQRRKAGPSYEA
jgi:hypothetical protein